MGPLNVIHVVIMVIVLVLLVLLFKVNNSIKLERRIGRYSTYSVNDEDASLMGSLESRYNHFVRKLESKVKGNGIIGKIANRYNKYIIVGDDVNPVRFIINKLVIGICFVFIVIVSLALRGSVISFLGFIFSFIVGYYIYDIFLMVNNKVKIKRIKNDMLRAVIIMNNAFKAGKSIMQAVDIARRELPSPISREFDKIYQDMLYGLSADVVFDRFAKRVDIEEVRYISSSLTILNNTGGNIVSVFDSIEKTLFDKKKLDEELKNATAASNLVVKVLMAIPFIFILLIYVISPDYFDPLFSSALGYFILFIMIIMFIVFVLVLNKVMKVKV